MEPHQNTATEGPLPKKARRNAIYIAKGSIEEKQIFQIGVNHVLTTEIIPQMAAVSRDSRRRSPISSGEGGDGGKGGGREQPR